ncbi:MAG: hypothetical protein ACR2JH_00275 [Solirubrobacteraceae bacterium]
MDTGAECVERFMSSLDAEVRALAHGEWGLVLDAAGYILNVGVAIRAHCSVPRPLYCLRA